MNKKIEMRARARILRVGLAVLIPVGLVCTSGGMLYTALPARDSEYASLARLALSYSLLRKGMRLKNVEGIMGKYYVVNNDIGFPRLMSYYERKKKIPWKLHPPPDRYLRTTTEVFGISMMLLMDVAHGNHNSDFVRLDFDNGILTRKHITTD